MSRNHGDVRSPSSGAASRSSAAADVSFTPRSSARESRIPRWKRRSSQSPSNSGSNSTHDTPMSEKAMGKRVSSSYDPGEGSSRASTPSVARKSGGLLLGSAFANGHTGRQGRAHHRSHRQGELQTDKRKLAAAHMPDGSARSSPLAREISNELAPGRAPTARPLSMDPAQLVQMALNLSESRRRHVSSTLPVPITPAGTRRAVSAGLNPGSDLLQPDSFNNSRSSYLNSEWDQSTSKSQRSSQQYVEAAPIAVGESENSAFSFSPATLSRAEKARRYFELAKEHRRLLEHLPPLKTDSSAPANFSTKATSSPGSAHYDFTRTPSNVNAKRSLGRPYNPLQALRNRRLRNRERRPLTAPPDTWQETDRIKGWIDGVETASKEPSFRPGEDQVRLPTFSGETEGAELLRSDVSKRHRRNDTVSSVITRPENGWTIEPAELLADTYWVEKDDNKTLVEDRHGTRIFPSRARLSVEVPRRSKESERRYESNSDRRGAQYESDDEDQLKSRRRNVISIPGRLRRHRVSRSASVSSSSSNEKQKPPALQSWDSEGGNENIGPLEKHMRRMISREEKGELSSPELLSPDHWDSRNSQFTTSRDYNKTANRVSATTANGGLSVDAQRRHRRARSADGRVGSTDHGISLTDDVTSNSTASPPPHKTTAMDLSSPVYKRAGQNELKTRGSNIPTFRSRSKERNNIEHNDFADNFGGQLSPVLTAESAAIQARSSLESSRPSQMKRKGTSDSNASSIRRINTTNTVVDGSIKDSANAMGRRLGRIGELVRNESSRLGDRFRGGRDRESVLDLSRVPSDVSDAEDTEHSSKQSKNGHAEGGVSPRRSAERDGSKPKFHTSGLPTFKSPAGRESIFTENAVQERGRLSSQPQSRPDTVRTVLSDLPGLPDINFPDKESVSDSDVPAAQASLYRPKSASQAHLSFGASPATRQGDRRSNLASSHDGRRHWSISDQTQQNPPQLVDKITARDISRVHTLLLASGIKAHEIHNKAGTARDAPLSLIAQVAEITGKQLNGLTRKEENLVAGRLLSETVASTLSEFEERLKQFQGTTAKDLGTQLDELSHRATDQLTKLVHETSEEVDAFNVELTTKQPQEVKRVDEAVDEMFRQRRRQFRLVRRTGFKILEWLVLGVMWWVWLMVVLFNTIRRGVVGVLLALKWLLWF